MKSKLVILSGAGISAESGVQTFRDSGGLWEGHDVMEVASIEGWHRNSGLVLDFYNKRRAQLKEVHPNMAHQLCAELENFFEVHVITQNVDNLHERAGSSKVIHLHGELTKVRSTIDDRYILSWHDDLNEGDLCPLGGQLRPHIVWFGELVPLLEDAALLVKNADIVIIIGTSMVVYPAAGLVSYSRSDAEIYYIDPNPQNIFELKSFKNLRIIVKGASDGMKILFDALVK